MPLGKSKATFSSLQEASINLVSLEELCHQGGARSRFPTFRKRLSVLVKFVRPLSPGCQATFSSLQEDSFTFTEIQRVSDIRIQQGHIFQPSRSFYPNWLSSEEICHQDGATSRFPAFRKRLSLLVKLGRPIWLSSEEICHEDGASSRFPAFRKRLSLLVKVGTPLSQG